MEGNIPLIRTLTENSLETKQWLSSQGVEWQSTIRAVVGALWERSSQAVEEQGSSFIFPLESKAKENGVEILLDVNADKLIQDNGHVIGVMATGKDGKTYEILASKGVVLATGGFSANVEMRQRYNTAWANLDDSIKTTNHPGATGDGIIMGLDLNSNLIKGMDHCDPSL